MESLKLSSRENKSGPETTRTTMNPTMMRRPIRGFLISFTRAIIPSATAATSLATDDNPLAGKCSSTRSAILLIVRMSLVGSIVR
jgi:hypothetical protein